LPYEAPRLAQVDLGRFTEELVQALCASYGVADHRVRLVVSGEHLGTDLERAVPLGLILNEPLTNALEHAFPLERRGRIQLQLDAGHGVLQLADDGMGLPPSVDVGRPHTLGLQLVQALVRQVGGRSSSCPGRARATGIPPLRLWAW
jgi:two-component sensor histidine kinase